MTDAGAKLLHADDAPALEQGAASRARDIVVTVDEDLAAVERDWREFEVIADGTVFQSFEWLACWQRHVGVLNRVRPAIVIGRDAQGRMLFLLPLATQPARFGRELTWLGSELCDYNGPLLAPDFSHVFGIQEFAPLWGTIATALRAHPRLGYDLLRLEKMPATVGNQRNPLMSLPVRRHPSGAWRTALPESWESFYSARRSATTRRRDRSKRKKLAAIGAVNLVEPDTPEGRVKALDVLMRQKARSFARMGVANLFERPGYAAFYHALAASPDTASIAHLSTLEVAGQAAAVNLGLAFRGRYYHLLASYTEDQDIARWGPGAVHLAELIALAIRRGHSVFDFTIGDEPYKADWCEDRTILYDHLKARTPLGLLAVLPLAARQRMKRLIKESPLLWGAFYKLRSALARFGGKKSPPMAAPEDDGTL